MEHVEVYPDHLTLMRMAADRFTRLAEAATTTRGRFSVALSGGGTPRQLYELLSGDEFSSRVDWSLVHVFWGDERCVPPDHSDSNYHMARKALLDYVPLPIGNIYRMRGELEPQAAAEDYEHKLRAFFSGREGADNLQPRFDLVLLGMGEDGHTASLFPGSPLLNEETRWVGADYVDAVQAWRLTLTPAAIKAAAHIIFLIAGENKAERLRQALTPEAVSPLPVQYIHPVSGDVLWLVDRHAAALL